MEESARGLRGIEVDRTAISTVDGERGELRYRGYRIEELVARARFLEVVGLVLDGELPGAAAERELEAALTARGLPGHVHALLRALPADTHPMTVLQVGLPLLDSAAEKRLPREGARAAQRAALLGLAARLPTLLAAWTRVRRGQAPLEPDPALPLHEDFLRMVRGERPAPLEVSTLDATQILQLEHGFNASTFTCRVAASTLAPLSMVLSAGVGALMGPLHGGADEAAWRMALEIGDPAAAPAWVDAALARKQKLMGLGHREYKVVDPRAVVLRPMALALARLRGQERAVETLVAVDEHAERRMAEKGKRVRANVEFYKGAVFAALGLEPDLFTTLFVLARVFGWGAHVLELWDENALVRPQASYVGPAPRPFPERPALRG